MARAVGDVDAERGTPARMAAAMPSGTLPTAPGSPASTSRPRYLRHAPILLSSPSQAHWLR
jgi:hypothetical protein